MANNKTWLLLGLAGAAAYFLFFRGKSSGAGGAKLQPAPVKANEQVRAASYRVIRARRSGLQYVPVEKGEVGAEITMTAPAAGKFTRNVIKEGSQLWAEFA